MTIKDLSFLSAGERVELSLRGLYEQSGYRKYRMNQFEEYDLYRENKSFLKSKQIISFNDLDGRMLALKPDVTLSIAKNTRATEDAPEKFYYVENVFRVDDSSGLFKEISQLGLEYIGRVDLCASAEVILLAQRTLRTISEDYVMQITHIGFVLSLLDSLGLSTDQRHQMALCIAGKNRHELLLLASSFGVDNEQTESLLRVASIGGPFQSALEKAREVAVTDEMRSALSELSALYKLLENTGGADNLMLDFSLIGDIDYYSGIAFQGFVPEVKRTVLSGGDYSGLLKKFGRNLCAIGFAVYLSELNGAATTEFDEAARGILTVALPKGRLGDQVYRLFEQIGYECAQIREDNRKLVFENIERGVRYLLVKPSDVAIYVEHGAADLGVVGKDILLDANPDIYELLDLDVGKCRLCVAAQNDYVEDKNRPLRVATKFAQAAKDYYASINREIEIIKLNGSIELAPILGLSDVIVDIVESGKTLVENDLRVIHTITSISARLIAHKPSYQFKREQVDQIAKALAEVSQ